MLENRKILWGMFIAFWILFLLGIISTSWTGDSFIFTLFSFGVPISLFILIYITPLLLLSKFEEDKRIIYSKSLFKIGLILTNFSIYIYLIFLMFSSPGHYQNTHFLGNIMPWNLSVECFGFMFLTLLFGIIYFIALLFGIIGLFELKNKPKLTFNNIILIVLLILIILLAVFLIIWFYSLLLGASQIRF